MLAAEFQVVNSYGKASVGFGPLQQRINGNDPGRGIFGSRLSGCLEREQTNYNKACK